jgi:4-hydroxy-tetrahydrodipicolinate reductase
MKIAIIGYGKMGQIIHEMALEKNWEIVFVANSKTTEWSDLKKANVAIEFSSPRSGFDNVVRCLELGVPVISGTTGWDNLLPEAIKKCKNLNGSFLHATNFSIGVNVLFQINKYVAGVMQHLQEYDCDITEIHHTQKRDAPSGTALTLAMTIMEKNKKYQKWALGNSHQPGTLPIHAQRIDPAPGTHVVNWKSEIDQITISHEAFSRRGFATGAIMAAAWIADKKGHFTMADMLKL